MERIEIERFVVATLPGRKLGDQLFGAGAYGKLFELFDERFAGSGPRKQVIRILSSLPDNGNWRPKVAQQAQALLAAQLPAISRPLEAGELPDGGLYLVGDFYSQPLDGLIQDEKGLRPVEVLPIVRQLLRGLAALHGRGMAHGDVRPKNIFLVPQNGTKLPPSVWLIDAPIGGLACWSNNALLDPESKAFYPPECHAASQTPSAKSDLWALGLTICEMLVGRQGNPQRSLNKFCGPGKELKASHVRSAVDGELKKGGVGFVLRHLVGTLLSEEADRPSDGIAGLDLLARLERRAASSPWVIGVAAGCFILTVLIASSFLQRARITSLTSAAEEAKGSIASLKQAAEKPEKELSSLRSANSKLNDDNQKLKNDNQTLSKDNQDQMDEIAILKSKLRGDPPPLTDDPHVQWRKLFALKGENYSDFHDALEKVKNEVAKIPPSAESTKTKSFTSWRKLLDNLVQKGKPWLTDKYPAFGESLATAFNEPWENHNLDDANDWLKSYETAAEKWRQWARDDDELPFGTIISPGFVDGLKMSVRAKQQILTWLTDAQGRTKWVARLTSGRCRNGDYGTTRQFGISGGDWVYTLVHDWAQRWEHEYGKENDNGNWKIEFSYRVTENKPLQCILYGERTSWKVGARTVLIEETIKGPLPFWRLHSLGRIKSEDGMISLRLEIDDCPGPPKDWKKGMDSR